jgi:uracil-DNA glycosylase
MVMSFLKKIVEQTVDLSWQQDILDALKLMNPDYLQTLQNHPEWLPKIKYLFSAFSLAKDKVRYVLLGESPYPRLQSANGYAFWDNAVGDLWSSKGLTTAVNRATSLRNFIKMLLNADGLLKKPFDSQSIANIDKSNHISSLNDLFNGMLQQGFLLLNASLIWSEEKPVRYHAKQWYPFINRIFDKLLTNQAVYFLLFGKVAQQFKALPPERCLVAEHPYVLSFIENTQVLNFFRPLSLLRTKP